MLRRVIVLWVLMSGFISSFVNACELKVRVSDIPPHFMHDADGRWHGLAVEFAQVLLKQAGCKPVFEPLPWKRALYNIEHGELDMMLNMSMTEERKRFIHFIGPQLDETVIILMKKGVRLPLKSLDDIKKLPEQVGIENGVYYGKAFDVLFKTDAMFQSKFYLIPRQEQKIAMLKNGNLSAVLDDLHTANYRLKTDEDYRGLEIHPFVVNQAWVYFGFSRKSVSQALLDRLQQAYSHAKTQGLFEQVLDQYR